MKKPLFLLTVFIAISIFFEWMRYSKYFGYNKNPLT